jgi:hypothetical protein
MRAAGIRQGLVRASPDDPLLLSELARALALLADELVRQGHDKVGAELYLKAIENLGKARAKSRAIDPNGEQMEGHLARLVEVLLRVGPPRSAAKVALLLRDFRPGPPERFVAGARHLAGCASLVGKGKGALSAAEQAERDEHAKQAVESLRRALARGFKDVARLRKDPALAPLHGRADFEKLLAEQKGRR